MEDNAPSAIETAIDHEHDLTVLVVTGAVSGQSIIEKIQAYYAGTPTRLILWDFSDASLEKIDTDEVAAIAKLAQSYSSLRREGKTALVFSSELGFGLGRMFDIRREIGGSTIQHMTFRKREEALQWLGVEG